MLAAWSSQYPGQYYAGGHEREHNRSTHFHAHFDEADSGQGFGQGLGQELSQAFGQGGGFGQGTYGHPMPQGYAYDDAYVGSYTRRIPRHRRAHSVPSGTGVNRFIMPAGFARPGMHHEQYQVPMGQFAGQHPPGFVSGTRLGGRRGRRKSAIYMEPYQEASYCRPRRRR